MTKTAILSPDQAAQSGIYELLMERARRDINSMALLHQGRAFIYNASSLPQGCANILMGELRAAGWSVQFPEGGREGIYYRISPGARQQS